MMMNPIRFDEWAWFTVAMTTPQDMYAVCDLASGVLQGKVMCYYK